MPVRTHVVYRTNLPMITSDGVINVHIIIVNVEASFRPHHESRRKKLTTLSRRKVYREAMRYYE